MATKNLTVVHELDLHGQHRLVLLHADGTSKVGEWVPVSKVATLFDLYANADPSNGLPPGVWKTREVNYQLLA